MGKRTELRHPRGDVRTDKKELERAELVMRDVFRVCAVPALADVFDLREVTGAGRTLTVHVQDPAMQAALRRMCAEGGAVHVRVDGQGRLQLSPRPSARISSRREGEDGQTAVRGDLDAG